MNNQLELELPAEYQNSDQYKEQKALFERLDKPRGTNIFLCYNSTTKRFFVARWWKRETIESYQSIKIIE